MQANSLALYIESTRQFGTELMFLLTKLYGILMDFA